MKRMRVLGMVSERERAVYVDEGDGVIVDMWIEVMLLILGKRKGRLGREC